MHRVACTQEDRMAGGDIEKVCVVYVLSHLNVQYAGKKNACAKSISIIHWHHEKAPPAYWICVMRFAGSTHPTVPRKAAESAPGNW